MRSSQVREAVGSTDIRKYVSGESEYFCYFSLVKPARVAVLATLAPVAVLHLFFYS